jgi:hypothetical protein
LKDREPRGEQEIGDHIFDSEIRDFPENGRKTSLGTLEADSLVFDAAPEVTAPTSKKVTPMEVEQPPSSQGDKALAASSRATDSSQKKIQPPPRSSATSSDVFDYSYFSESFDDVKEPRKSRSRVKDLYEEDSNAYTFNGMLTTKTKLLTYFVHRYGTFFSFDVPFFQEGGPDDRC